MASIYKVGGTYTIAFSTNADGKRQRVCTGVGDKPAAKEIKHKVEELIGLRIAHRLPGADLARWIETCPDRLRAQLVKVGLVDDRHTRVDDLVKSFEQYLADKGNTPDHVEKTVNRLNAILTGCKVKALADVTGAVVQRWLGEMRTPGDAKSDKKTIGRQTSNYYLRAVRHFTRWLVRERVLSADPLIHLQGLNARTETKEKMVPTIAEMRLLLTATKKRDTIDGSTGAERALAYRLAVESGLRAGELRSLTKASFALTGESPTVTIEAAYAKNRRRDTLPLRSDTAALLKKHLANKLPGAAAFTLTGDRMAEVIRADAQAAGIRTVDDAGRILTFHSLRHCTGTYLAAAGVHPKVIQRMMRHSTITLTLDRYTRAFKSDEADAVTKLPSLSEAIQGQAKATGTDGTAARAKNREHIRERADRKSSAQAAPSGNDGGKISRLGNIRIARKSSDSASKHALHRNRSAGIRTQDQGIMSPVL